MPALSAANPALRLVDLSGAFRFQGAETLDRWYKLRACDLDGRSKAVYGLPELYADDLPDAQLVANPGCYSTSVILGLRPLVEAGWVNLSRGIVCDCKSGVSGAGKEPKRETHFVEVNENFRAYGLFTHRHTPEIAEHTGLALQDFVFTTHLLPVERGILSTLYVSLSDSRGSGEIEALYRKFFAETASPKRLGVPRMMPRGCTNATQTALAAGAGWTAGDGSTRNRSPSTVRTTTPCPSATLAVEIASQSSP